MRGGNYYEGGLICTIITMDMLPSAREIAQISRLLCELHQIPKMIKLESLDFFK